MSQILLVKVNKRQSWLKILGVNILGFWILKI